MYFHIRYNFHYLNEKGIESILANLFRCISDPILGKTRNKKHRKSEFVERFLELSLFYGLSSPLNSEMICIFPYF